MSTVGGRSSRIVKRYTITSPICIVGVMLPENRIVAMIRWVEAGVDSIWAVCKAFESGPAVEGPCLAEMADYDQVYRDSVTGASVPSKIM